MGRGSTAAGEGPKVLSPAYVVRMRPALAAQIIGKAYARIPWPRLPAPAAVVPPAIEGDRLPLKLNDRLFLVEFNGGRTGRADLVSVAAMYDDGTLWALRGYGFHQGKHDDDLTEVGYRSVPTSCAILEAVPA